MPGAVWFPDARLSYTENLLRRNDDGAAIISRGEAKSDRVISYAELNQEVNRLARAYRALGIEPGGQNCCLHAEYTGDCNLHARGSFLRCRLVVLFT